VRDYGGSIAGNGEIKVLPQDFSAEDQKKIWRVLADASNVKLCDQTISNIVAQSPGISGRDVKNLLKLSSLLAKSESKEITPEMVEFAKKFKPTKSKVSQ